MYVKEIITLSNAVTEIVILLTCASFIQGISVEFWFTPLAVESSSVIKTLEALSSGGVTVTTGSKVYVVITLALPTLAILFLKRKRTQRFLSMNGTKPNQNLSRHPQRAR